MTEVIDMIGDLMQFLREESGIALDRTVSDRIESRLCALYGGEQVYVCKRPGLKRAVQAAAAERKTVREIAATAGISQRHARRLLRGR